MLVLDVRELIPAMAALSGEHKLNQLVAEAIGSAAVLDAELVVAMYTPKLRDIAAARGLRYRLAPRL